MRAGRAFHQGGFASRRETGCRAAPGARSSETGTRAAFPVSNSPLIYSANAGRQYYSIQPIFLPLALLR